MWLTPAMRFTVTKLKKQWWTSHNASVVVMLPLTFQDMSKKTSLSPKQLLTPSKLTKTSTKFPLKASCRLKPYMVFHAKATVLIWQLVAWSMLTSQSVWSQLNHLVSRVLSWPWTSSIAQAWPVVTSLKVCLVLKSYSKPANQKAKPLLRKLPVWLISGKRAVSISSKSLQPKVKPKKSLWKTALLKSKPVLTSKLVMS